MNIEVEFHLTPEIIKRGVYCFWKSCYVRKRELFLTGIFLCLLVTISLIDGAKSWMSFVIIGLYGFLALWFWIFRFKVFYILLKAKLNQYNQLVDGEMKMRLKDDVVVLTDGQKHSEFRWKELRHIIESDKIFLLLWGELNFTILPVDQVSAGALSEIRQKIAKRTLTPPVLQKARLDRGQPGKAINRAKYSWTSFMMAISLLLIIHTFFGLRIERRTVVEGHPLPNKCWVNVLRIESKSNYFTERIRVHSLRDMKVSIGLGDPRVAGQSVQIDADGDASTCEVLFEIRTSSNTTWHSEIAGSIVDTTLSTSSGISNVETNLADSYERPSTITLANIGDKKVLLSVE